jgi:hypothetical protein
MEIGATVGLSNREANAFCLSFARQLRCGKGYIDWLCAPFRALLADENATHSVQVICARLLRIRADRLLF